MQLAHIPLDQLNISALNMRHGKRAADISDILPSVRARGLLVPLLVRPNGQPETFEIVAGRRRYFAAKSLADERGEGDPLPCAIMEDGDDADALEASLIENLARLDPDEVSQWETFSRLVRQGRTVPDIAATFGITDLKVKRILALGYLLPKSAKPIGARRSTPRRRAISPWRPRRSRRTGWHSVPIPINTRRVAFN